MGIQDSHTHGRAQTAAQSPSAEPQTSTPLAAKKAASLSVAGSALNDLLITTRSALHRDGRCTGARQGSAPLQRGWGLEEGGGGAKVRNVLLRPAAVRTIWEVCLGSEHLDAALVPTLCDIAQQQQEQQQECAQASRAKWQ